MVRSFDDTGPGLVSFSRFDPESKEEFLLAFNTSGEALDRFATVGYPARNIEVLHGECDAYIAAPGSANLSMEPFGWCIARLSGAAE